MSTDPPESCPTEERAAQFSEIVKMSKRAVARSRALRGVTDVDDPEGSVTGSKPNKKPED